MYVKEIFVYSSYGIALDGAGDWRFNIITLLEMLKFSVLIIIYHLMLTIKKMIFLVLGEGPTFGINGSFGSPEKKFSINLSKANTNFCLSLHYNGHNSSLFVNGKKIYKFKTSNKKHRKHIY